MRPFSLRGVLPRRLPSFAPIVSALLIVALSACDRDEKPVVFGVAGPFRTPYGASMRLGAELARKEINEQGGIGGRPLELRFLDDAESPDSALHVAEKFYRDPEVVAVIGHVNSSTTVHAAATYQKGLPAVATSATSPAISRLGEWIFRVASSDSANSVQLARLARRIDRPTAILYENEDYGRGLTESFRTAFTAAGGTVLEANPYLPSTADFTPYLQRMKQRGVGLVFLAGLESDAARIIQQAKQVGLDVRFLGGDGIEGLVGMGPAYDGTLVGLLFHPEASRHAAGFSQRFRETYRRQPDSFAGLGYDAARLLARAAREGGAERRAIRDYLAGVGREGRTPPFEGATGTIRFDANGDPVDKDFAVGMIRAGKILLTDGQ